MKVCKCGNYTNKYSRNVIRDHFRPAYRLCNCKRVSKIYFEDKGSGEWRRAE